MYESPRKTTRTELSWKKVDVISTLSTFSVGYRGLIMFPNQNATTFISFDAKQED